MDEDSLSGPGPGTFERVQARPVPSVAAFESADSAFTSGSPFDGSSECWSVFDGPAGGTGFALAGDDDVFDSALGQLVIDGGYLAQ